MADVELLQLERRVFWLWFVIGMLFVLGVIAPAVLAMVGVPHGSDVALERFYYGFWAIWGVVGLIASTIASKLISLDARSSLGAAMGYVSAGRASLVLCIVGSLAIILLALHMIGP